MPLRHFRRFQPRSLRLRLLAIVLGTLLVPLAGAVLYLDHEADRRLGGAKAMASDLADQGVRRQEELIGSARTLLSVLSLVPEIRSAGPGDTAGCVALLRRLPERQPWTTGAWVADPSGRMICGTTGPGNGLDLGDRDYFRRAVATGDFVLSGYIVGRRTGNRIMMAVQPLVHDGAVERVIGVSISLDWYEDLIQPTGDTGTRLAVLDADGVVLARQPDPERWVGRSLAGYPHVQRMLADDHGVLEAVGADGTARIWSYRRLAGTGTTFVVGVPVGGLALETRRDFALGLGVIAVTAALGFAAIWGFTRASVLNWTQALVAAAERIGIGPAARVDTDGAPVEIAAVGAAFNRMAERLAAREREVDEARRAAEAAEAAAREASARLSQVLESTSDLVFALDRSWRLIYMNQRARDVLAQGRDLAGQAFWEVFPEVAGTVFEDAYRTAMERGEAASVTDYDALRDAWYEGTVFPSPEGVVVYVADVTRRIRNEQALAAASREKSELLAQLNALLENAPVGFAFFDADHRIVRVNDSLAEIDGLPASSHLGRPVGEVLPALVPAVGPIIDRVFATGLPLPNQEIEGETPLRPGEHRNWLTGWFPVVADGAVPYVGAVIMEISDLRATEKALKEAKRTAEVANRAKSEFLANMSHEIRTPMNAIFGLVHLLQQTPLSASQRDYAQKIRVSAQSLLGILNDILDFSKVEAGKMELERVEFRLDELLDNLATILSASARDKDIEVLFSVAPDVPRTLIGDPLRLQQVLINLAGNAVKFTHQGEVVVSVRAQEVAEGHATLLFAVRDTGIGITAEQQLHLFEAFSQGDSSTTRRYGGTGLGLAICTRLVGLMGGAMEVTSEPGRGSEFRFMVRFDRAAGAETRDLPELPLHRRLRVLVVDDNPTAREGLSSLVSGLGWSATACAGATAAIATLERAAACGESYDLVLMDWQMPGMDGVEACRRIRQSHAASAPVVIMVTAFGRERLAASAGDQDLDGVIVKPVTASTLLDGVTTAYARSSGAAPATRAPAESESRPLTGRRLLLVEDNPIGRQVARETLERYGAAVVAAGDGGEAVALARSGDARFDAVLMDVQMPGMDGFETTRLLRTLPGFARLPIIAATASALPADIVRCREAGMDDHVAKPLDPDRLVATLARHIGIAAPPPAGGRRDGYGDLPADLPGIDLADALHRVQGDTVLYRDLMAAFAAGHADVGDVIVAALAAGDLATAKAAAHDLKSLAGSLGASRLSAAADAVQIAAGRGDRAAAEAPLPVLRDQLAALLESARRLAPPDAAPAGRAAEEPMTPARRAVLGAAAERLWSLLGDNNFAAAEEWPALRDALGRQADPALVAAVGHAVDALDFARARGTLRRIADDLDLPLAAEE
ncbi:response regulator [Azospirillum sp. ST 5-10]|uniref:response regulator n=1 Tax=unclassified Azospirillum TaxID=2630922 RepID=UPI003F49C3FE